MRNQTLREKILLHKHNKFSYHPKPSDHVLTGHSGVEAAANPDLLLRFLWTPLDGLNQELPIYPGRSEVLQDSLWFQVWAVDDEFVEALWELKEENLRLTECSQC